MLHRSLFVASTLVLVTGVAAQATQTTQTTQTTQAPEALTATKMPTPLRHAGIYHVQSGTWTRTGGQVSNFGPDIVYSNTAETGYFNSAGGAGGFAPLSENFDEGGLPGTTNGNPFAAAPNRDLYAVNCAQIAYCDLGVAGSSGWTLSFYCSHTPCTASGTPDATVVANGLPAAGGCWIVDIDLIGSEVCLDADGGALAPGWDNDPTLDSFGWSYTYSGTDGAAGNEAGFVLCGNPSVTDPSFFAGGLPLDGSNTYYGTTNCADVGTGYLTEDSWWLEDPTGVASNCYFFGGYSNNNGSCTGPSVPYASWWLELAASAGGCPGLDDFFGFLYCLSNPNSTGLAAAVQLQGSEFAADDLLTLSAVNLPANSFGYFIVSETQGFVANPLGSQGNLCVLGQIGRFVGPGQILTSDAMGNPVSLSTAAGQFSLTAMPTPTGPRMSVQGTTDRFQYWFRDVSMGVATSNFSDGTFHTWL